jgi:hypothetical protein
MMYAAPYQTILLSGNGRCHSLQVVDVSDEKTKTNIETIENASWKIQQLRGVSFTNKEGFRAIGSIAQEEEHIVQEVVSEQTDKDKTKGVMVVV